MILHVTRMYIFRVYLHREPFGDCLAEKKVTLSSFMNSNMVKPEKYDHLHLGYHSTIPLNSQISDSLSCWFALLKCLQQNWSVS